MYVVANPIRKKAVGSNRLIETPDLIPDGLKLSPCEIKVLPLVAQGLTSRQIGRLLCVSHKTVEYHISHILGKFNCGNRTGSVSRAFIIGVLSHEHWPPKLGKLFSESTQL